jgi:glycerophosphoryl diester phosphodiesterase
MSFTLYSHRGNIWGPNIERENTLDYIDEAINARFGVEIDVWLHSDNNIYLGHDEPTTLVSYEYLILRHDQLLLHAKNISAFTYFSSRTRFNTFFHTEEAIVYSTSGNIIVHPKHYPVDLVTSDNYIYSMPELSNIKVPKFKSIISDYVGFVRQQYEGKSVKSNLPEIMLYE